MLSWTLVPTNTLYTLIKERILDKTILLIVSLEERDPLEVVGLDALLHVVNQRLLPAPRHLLPLDLLSQEQHLKGQSVESPQ
jgi:hypothetical protein